MIVTLITYNHRNNVNDANNDTTTTTTTNNNNNNNNQTNTHDDNTYNTMQLRGHGVALASRGCYDHYYHY